MQNVNDRYVDYLDFSKTTWKRPEGPTRVWRVVDGRRKGPNGEIPKFSIQEVPEGLQDDVIDFMINYFIAEEPLGVDRGIPNDPLALRELRTMWRGILHQGVSIVALVVKYDPDAKPVIAGVNMLSVVTAEDEAKGNVDNKKRFRSNMRIVMGMQSNLAREVDVLQIYGVDKYLGGIGLSVHPSLRGQGIGEALLRARDDIGLAYQIPISETIFTATASQIVASRVGFEVAIERKYSELLDEDGNVAFPGVSVKAMKLMVKRLY